MVVKEIADSEPPPRATNRKSVKENCQGWSVRVITKLVVSELPWAGSTNPRTGRYQLGQKTTIVDTTYI